MIGPVSQATSAQKNNLPNIVLILCDDLGFSDLGCYGGEINTPNIDKLAEDGLRFSQFKNAGRSCPSRAALLTGRYQHQVGMGWMTAVDEHRPGYRGQINAKYPTIAEILKSHDYQTYMSGKWHITLDSALGKPNGSFPTQRGFDRYYGCLHGGGSYHNPVPLYNDITKIDSIPEDYYYTTAITDSAVSFVLQHNTDAPMFLYVAHYAPHLPLEAPSDYVEKCIDRYKVGYDILRRSRFEKQKGLGIVPQDMELPIHDREFGGKRPEWNSLTKHQQEIWTEKMATYAAMIEIMDEGVGKLVESIRMKGMLNNTIFMFLSDNGASDEGGFLGKLMSDLSNTPYRNYKKSCYLGGISTPFVFTYGDENKNRMKGQICSQPTHIIDILPTCMDVSDTTYPIEYNYKELPGKSLLLTMDKDETDLRTLFFEHQGSCSVIDNTWKLVKTNSQSSWELIDLSKDPFETKDVSALFPKKTRELEDMWKVWAESHHVLPLEDQRWIQRINYYIDKNPDQDGID